MQEGLNQWHYVIAAYAIGAGGTLALVGWVLGAMRRAERRRDQAKGKRDG
jgi:hypothetical protein